MGCGPSQGQTLIGIEERDTASGIHVFRVHYTANPLKRETKWQEDAAKGMVGGKAGKAWRQEMEIDWTVASGLGVYEDDFIREWHVAKSAMSAYANLPLYRGWDLGPTHVSPACMIAQLDSMGRLNVLDEIVVWNGRGEVKQAFIDEFCDRVIVVCNQDYGPGFEWVDVADPASWVKQTVTSEERSAIEIMNRAGIHPRKGPVTFTLRKDAMHDRLTRAIGGRASIWVDPRCSMLIEGFAGKYCYEQIGETGKYRSTVEKNAWSHIMNAMEYVVGYLFVPNQRSRDEDDEERRRRRGKPDRVTGY